MKDVAQKMRAVESAYELFESLYIDGPCTCRVVFDDVPRPDWGVLDMPIVDDVKVLQLAPGFVVELVPKN